VNPKNPFYILEIAPGATPGEIEREGRKILGLIEIGAAKALRYTCPLGSFERDATMVREALFALRDPKRRAREACLVRFVEIPEGSTRSPTDDADAPLERAYEAAGYRGL
jgi:hypothetical protein